MRCIDVRRTCNYIRVRECGVRIRKFSSIAQLVLIEWRSRQSGALCMMPIMLRIFVFEPMFCSAHYRFWRDDGMIFFETILR